MAKSNPFRFSTKYQDDETDLLYYGYRYHDASTGRWFSRDPLNELGSKLIKGNGTKFRRSEEMALYAFVQNSPVNLLDPHGESVMGGVLTWIGADCAVPEPSDAAWPKWLAYGIAICATAAIDGCLPSKCVLIKQEHQGEAGDPYDLDGNYMPEMEICIYRCPKLGVIRRYQGPGTKCPVRIPEPKP